MKKIELLSPAGNLKKLKTAILYGADAVYIGGKKFSLRARASNFDLDDIKEACLFAEKHNAKIYVTMNIIPHNEDFTDLEEYLIFLENVGVKAIIVSSMHIIKTALRVAPKLEIHLSTQLSITNSAACNYYQSIGADRVVLGREVSLKEMKKIKENTNLSLEAFVHGGMCSAYSGRCMLSNYFVNRDANRGGCAHSCRWNYRLFDDEDLITSKDQFFNFGSKDLVGLKAIGKMIDLGIDSLKVEGRMKSEYYLATIIRAYRMLIDDYYAGKEIDYDYYESELAKAENRASSTGFLFGDVTPKEQLYSREEIPTKEFVGVVLDYDKKTKVAKIEQRNYFEPNNQLEFFGPKLDNSTMVVNEIWDEENNLLDAARHPQQIVFMNVDFTVSKNDMIRLVK